MITMLIYKNIHIKENLIFFVFLKIITIIILILINHPYDNVFNYGRTIENINKRRIGINIYFKRYLAEYVGETEIDKTGLYNNSPYYLENKGTRNYDDYVSTYRNMKNRDSIKLKLYKTGYNHRCSRKKGLSKLDCYYENKIFKKIDYIYNLADNWHKDKKSFKKMILNKYGFYFFLILFPLLGLIFPVLFGDIFGSTPLLKLCDPNANGHSQDGKDIHMTQTEQVASFYTNAVISLTMSIINIFVIIYISLKIIKYEKLKACKGKMNFKEYYRFCKGIISNKTK